VQVRQEPGTHTRPGSLIEADGSNPERPEDEGPLAIDQPDPLRKQHSELLRAFEFLDACLLPKPSAERGRPPADAAAKSEPAADTPASEVTVRDLALQTTAAQAALGSAPADHDSGVARWRMPRGLLYWLGLGVAGGVTWRMTSSLYETTVAALVASAALIGLELLLRLVDPRLARRLGFARSHRGAAFYGAGAVLGLGTGLAVTHIL
jgi:hypothetical protein